jgi:hypothetical protein
VLFAGALLLALGVLVFRFSKGEPNPVAPTAEPPAVEPASSAADLSVASHLTSADLAAQSPPPALAALPKGFVAGSPQALTWTRTLVTNLTQLDPKAQNVTPELSAWWRSQFNQLKNSGADGAVAIREFLARNEDISFAGLTESDSVGYPSLRMAMLDVLAAVGGQAGIEGLLDVLHATALPGEIAQLAQHLETLAPAQYRQELLDATRSVLAQADRGELKNLDVGSLFQVLAKYGGADAVPSLQAVGDTWKSYAAIALGNLPDGAGVPALLELARTSSGQTASAVWPMVAEHAATSDEARNLLLEAVRDGSVPAPAWPKLARALGGYEYHIMAPPATLPANVSYNNSHSWNFLQTSEQFIAVVNVAGLSTRQINARLGLIDQLNGLNPPEGAQAALVAGRKALLDELQRRPK